MSKHLKYQSIILLAIGLVSVAACVQVRTVPEQSEVSVGGTYRHTASGMEFPERIESFYRVRVTRFDSAERDVGVGYELLEPSTEPSVIALGKQASVTVYIYPSSDLSLDAHFEAVKAETLKAHPSGVVVEEKEMETVQTGEKITGWAVTFSFSEEFAGTEQPLLSHLYLFKREAWFVKYRVTHPTANRELVEGQVTRLVESLTMPKGS